MAKIKLRSTGEIRDLICIDASSQADVVSELINFANYERCQDTELPLFSDKEYIQALNYAMSYSKLTERLQYIYKNIDSTVYEKIYGCADGEEDVNEIQYITELLNEWYGVSTCN